MMRHIIIAFLLLISPGVHSAEINGIIRGQITDKNTREPLAGVYVIYGRQLGTTSDDKGNYQFSTASGKLSVTFQFIGYESVTKEITARPNDTVELNIELAMKIREIDQIVVSADKIEKRVAELSVSMDIIKSSFTLLMRPRS
jgi:hypothetical protein